MVVVSSLTMAKTVWQCFNVYMLQFNVWDSGNCLSPRRCLEKMCNGSRVELSNHCLALRQQRSLLRLRDSSHCCPVKLKHFRAAVFLDTVYWEAIRPHIRAIWALMTGVLGAKFSWVLMFVSVHVWVSSPLTSRILFVIPGCRHLAAVL